MKVLYISALSSKRLINHIHETNGCDPGFAVQKFNRLIVSGLMENGVGVNVLSSPPIPLHEERGKWVQFRAENENNVPYKYIPFLNYPLLKHLFVFVYVFFYVIFWSFRMRTEKDKSIICDVLSFSSCTGALLASKLLGLESVAVVTDLYNMLVGKKQSGWFARIRKQSINIQEWCTSSFSYYVLLTEAMNAVVNPKNRPYIIMEALCDVTTGLSNDSNVAMEKDWPITVMYAGGIEEEYGLGMLVDAFRLIARNDIQLIIYGSGSYDDTLKNICKTDSRIVYKGVVPNEQILEAEKRATLLVNPRFTGEEYTKYSFPSKNMEYMASGTPLLTTHLPGIPDEYNPYVFYFGEETCNAYSQLLNDVLSLPSYQLSNKGRMAREFVLKEKNNIKQTKRIIQLINA